MELQDWSQVSKLWQKYQFQTGWKYENDLKAIMYKRSLGENFGAVKPDDIWYVRKIQRMLRDCRNQRILINNKASFKPVYTIKASDILLKSIQLK